ncbi:GAF domain-containing sensor histidine kinase [soil metagenome]
MEEPPQQDFASLDERRLRSLIDVGRSLVSELDMEAVLRRVLEVGRELTGARYAAIGIVAADGGLERFLFTGIDEETRQTIGDLPQGHGVLGMPTERAQPMRLERIGDHPRSFGFPAGHPPMETFLGVPIEIRGRAYGTLYLTEKDEGTFTRADEESAVVLAEWAAVAIHNARLYSGSVQRRDELQQTVARLEATTEIARAVGGETRLERVLETIVKRARALVEARSLVALLEDRGQLVVAAAAGEFDREATGQRLTGRGGSWRTLLASGRAERVSDISTRLGISAEHLGVSASTALIAPLSFQGRPLGALVAFDRLHGGPAFDLEHERLLTAFAASAATAVATAQSVAEDSLRESIAAAERERARWARELHDETLQGLGALRVLLASALRTGNPDNLGTATRNAVDQIATEIANLRSLITELRPAALDEIGLGAAIESLASAHATATGVEVNVDLALAWEDRRERRSLGPELELAIYRLVQEALTNVSKHAGAEQVWIEVSQDEGTVLVAVRDDGEGFDPEDRGAGFGLIGMRERVTLAGGTLEITSDPKTGTALRAMIPLHRRDAVGGLLERRGGP